MWARRIGGPLIAVVVLGFQWILKLKFVFFAVAKFGFVTTAVTMVVSVGAYTLLWGWQFAALFVVLLFVHELGHALWLRNEGIPAGAPVFIPFLGAVISMRDMPRNAYIEAKVGLAGPVLGTLGAAVVLGLGELQDSDLLRAAASTRASCSTSSTCCRSCRSTAGARWPAIHPSLWIAGIAGLAALLVVSPNAILDPDPAARRPRGLGALALAQGRAPTRATTPCRVAARADRGDLHRHRRRLRARHARGLRQHVGARPAGLAARASSRPASSPPAPCRRVSCPRAASRRAVGARDGAVRQHGAVGGQLLLGRLPRASARGRCRPWSPCSPGRGRRASGPAGSLPPLPTR